MKFTCVLFLLDILTFTVKGWPCVSPIRNVYRRVNTDAVLQYTVDVTGLVADAQFEVKFHDNSLRALIRYKPDRTYTTDAVSGVSITGDTSGNVKVTLANVQQSNAGIYYMSRAGEPTRCNCLYILGFPTKPVITINRVPSVGESAILRCSSTFTTTPSNHSLSLTYNWRVGNVDNPGGSRYSYSTNRNTLTLSNIIKDDVNIHFTCTATEDISDGYTSSSSESFSMDVYYGPENIGFSPSDTSYERTENSNFDPVTCTASCYPNCTFKWTEIGQGAVVTNTAVLSLGTLTSSEAGVYRCTATRSGSITKAKDITINVIYGPKSMSFSPETTSYRHDENFDLPPVTCSAECWGCIYSWTGPQSYTLSGQILDLHSLKRSMAGSYSCTATNTKLSPQPQGSKSLQIEVRYGPDSVTLSPGNINYTVDEGSTLRNIRCEADCFPACRYKWIKEGQSAAVSNTNTLSLGQIEKSYAGKFTCRATNGDNPSRWFEKHVIFNVRYGPYQSSTILSPSTHEYTKNDGDNLQNISCSADCYPDCTYTWTKTRQGKIATDSTTGVLSLGSLHRVDAAVYICTARNPGKTVSPTTTKHVTVNVRYGPDTATISVPSPYYLTEGDKNINVECSSDCYPGCSYVWTNLTDSSIISTDGVLSLQIVNRYMAGSYKCSSGNTATQYAKSSEQIISFIVKERTSVKSFYIGERDDQSNVTVDEGEVDVTLTCVVGGDPAPNVKIAFKGESLKEKFNTNELVFVRRDVACVHSGVYTCVGNDSYGRTSSRNATLFVKCSPRPLRQIFKNITSQLNVPASLTFEVIAYPEPEFHWYKQYKARWIQLLSNEDFHVFSSGLQTNLTILNVSSNDFGQYRVTVENNIGIYDQYLFFSKEGVTAPCPDSSKVDQDSTTLIITATTLGMMCIVLAVYATGITVLYKRKRIRNGTRKPHVPAGESTYTNIAYMADTTTVHEITQRRHSNENASGVDEESLQQYTDLAPYSRDEKSTYDLIQRVK